MVRTPYRSSMTGSLAARWNLSHGRREHRGIECGTMTSISVTLRSLIPARYKAALPAKTALGRHNLTARIHDSGCLAAVAVMTILGRGLMTWPSRAARRACRATRPTELILATPPLASKMSTNSILSVIVSPQVFSSSNSTSVDNDRGCYRSCPQRDSSRAPHAPCRPHATAQWARFLTAPPPPPP